ncbi:hypothetical protein [Mesorhizobium sp. STM 4661]|uniref:hypothetical protein n=1 Tax=Mesorhizobium sp. STM 4661 TaxID=1297570 RepID=UPI0012FB4CCB|nr:hypothetical protein [Mesorhizobium sp. STM 4661]
MKSCNAARLVLSNAVNYRRGQKQQDEHRRITLRDESELKTHILQDRGFAFDSEVDVANIGDPQSVEHRRIGPEIGIYFCFADLSVQKSCSRFKVL